MEGCNLVNTPVESRLKLSSYGEVDKVDLTLYKKSCLKLEVFEMYNIGYLYGVGMVS